MKTMVTKCMIELKMPHIDTSVATRIGGIYNPSNNVEIIIYGIYSRKYSSCNLS